MKAVAAGLEVRLSRVALWIVPVLLTACGGQSLPTQPSAIGTQSATVIVLEGEPGSGEGKVVQRSRASGGQTIHLGPGEQRRWAFDVRTGGMQYALSVTYSNGKEGENEQLTFTVDGVTVRSFQDRDSGDSTEGWNVFVTDPAGTSTLGTGHHTLVLEVSGGDGCVEIDIMTLSPTSAG